MDNVLPDGISGILFTKEQISARVEQLGAKISHDLVGREPLLIGILKGAAVFFSDLARAVTLPCQMDFITASSYKNTSQSLGNIKISSQNAIPVKGRDVIIVEDILDTGRTLRYIMDSVLSQQPMSLRLCVLLDKPSRRVADAKGITADYTGFTIPDHFVVGYGLDYAERFRNLPYIAIAHV